jgi:hypothetical protein
MVQTLRQRKTQNLLLIIFFFFVATQLWEQADPWVLKADKIDPSDYYGITVANGGT